MSQRPKILGICGSLRQESNSLAILNSLEELLAPKADFEVFCLNEIPLYNQDLDTEIPLIGVARLRQAIAEADAVLIATPEYNYGIPGVLKNALDWASRPYGQSSLIGKPVLSISSSPAFTGGVRALAHLNETLLAIGANVIGGPQIVIGNVHGKIQNGRLIEEATLSFLSQNLEGLLSKLSS